MTTKMLKVKLLDMVDRFLRWARIRRRKQADKWAEENLIISAGPPEEPLSYVHKYGWRGIRGYGVPEDIKPEGRHE